MKFFSWERFFVLAAVVAFLLLKLTNLHFRFSDEDVYFYMADAIRHGIFPYRDFSLADPPFFVYLLSGIKMLVGSHLVLLKAVPAIFDSATAICICLILKRLGSRLAWLGPLVYLASFTVLATSDFVTGAEVTVFFLTLGVLLDLKNKPALSGASFALACLAKLYAAPVLIGLLVWKAYKKDWRALGRIIAGGLITSVIVLLPSLIIAPKQLFYYTVLHQFHRPHGISKWSVFTFFGAKEWLVIIAGLIGASMTKHKVLAAELVCAAIFFLWFRDLYYLYLHVLMPLLIILAIEALGRVRNFNLELCAVAAIVYLAFFGMNINSYWSSYRSGSIFTSHAVIAEGIKKLPKPYPVYGVQEIAPLLALESGRSIFDNVIDTNTQNFAAGTLNREAISERAVASGVYLLAQVADTNGRVHGYEGYWSEEAFAYCKEVEQFPDEYDSAGFTGIFECKK